jgi:hypothetical protein
VGADDHDIPADLAANGEEHPLRPWRRLPIVVGVTLSIRDTATPAPAHTDGPEAMGDVCLFAFFDPADAVDEWVFYYLARLRDLSFSIIFISTSPIGEADLARLRTYCCDVIVRANQGLDFASWAAAFHRHEKSISGRLLLANSSVYGPLDDLTDALNRLTSRPADFYGMVESIDISAHLQSWFLLFEPHVARSPTLKEFLSQPFTQMTKDQIIVNGEVALSKRLISAGLRYQALYRASAAGWAERLFASNPMHLFWREMITVEGVPFLKVALPRDNPLGLNDSAEVGKVVGTLNPALWNLIAAHQARIGGHSPQDPPSLWRRIMWSPRRLYHVLMRRGYRLHRAHRRVAEAYNFLLLMGLYAIRAPAREIRRYWLSRAG